MKKLSLYSTIALVVGLVLVFVAAILNSVEIVTDGFNKTSLIATFLSIGYLIAAVGGIVLAASSISEAIKTGSAARMKTVSMITTAVAVGAVIACGLLRSLSAAISPAASKFQINATNGVLPVLTQVSYIFALIGAVILIGVTVAGLAKGGDLKKVIMASSIVTAIGVAMVVVAAVLNGADFTITNFVKTQLTSVITSMGYLAAVLAGALLTGLSVVSLAKGGEAKRLTVVSSILTAVGLVLVLIAAVMGSLTNIPTTPFAVTYLLSAFNTIGYVVAILAGVLLVASGVSTAVKGEK